MEEIYIGKICNYFGLKGEMKVSSDFEKADKAFVEGNHIYINGEEHVITSVRFHHFNYLVEIDHLLDINLITKYIGADIYIKRDELKLGDKEYLLNDLIGFNIILNNKKVGKVTSTTSDKINPLLRINDEYFIPVNGEFIVNVDLLSRNIICENIEGLML